MSGFHEIIESAHIAQRLYAQLPGSERLKLMNKLVDALSGWKDDFVRIISAETGKPRADAESEFMATLERIGYTMQDAREMFGTFVPSGWSDDTRDRMAIVMRVPLGVVAVIGPFNYPLFIPAGKAVAALLAGNAVILKPSSYTPNTMILFEKAVLKAGFPVNVFRVVTGSGSTVGRELVSSPLVDAVLFTGSTPVGEEITRTAGVKRLQLELGGKGVALVLGDADLELAAEQIVEGALKNAGQRCDAVSVVYYVGPNNGDRFVEHVKAEVVRWIAGHPEQPLISENAVVFVHRRIAQALADGANLIIGGTVRGRYVQATVLDHVSPLSDITHVETFGPVIPIVRLDTVSEALSHHNALSGGLDSSIFTKDLVRAIALAGEMRTGSVTINAHPKHGVGMFPYGGTGTSGIGREGIGYTLREVTELKTVVLPAYEPSNTPKE